MAAAFALAACGSDDDSGSDPLSSGGGDKDAIVVGSANFPESELLMQMYAQTLEAAGAKVETKPNIGAREIYMKAFESGDIDLLPEYNGALLAFLSPDGVPEGVTSPEDVYDALQKVLPEGSETLPQSAAEDKDTLTVTQETADKYSLSTIEDLQPVAGKLTVGAGPGVARALPGPGRSQGALRRGVQGVQAARRRWPADRRRARRTARSTSPTSSRPTRRSRPTAGWSSTTRRTSTPRRTSSR